MARLIDFEHIRQALSLRAENSVEAQQRMAPNPRGWQKRNTPPKRAAVMILVFPNRDNRLNVVLTLRNASLRGHSGQVSFPGGQQDQQDKSLTATALRETYEEIGICGGRVSVLGSLPRFYIPASHHDVFPTVARYDGLPAFVPNPVEVEEVFCFALEDLLQPRFKRKEQRIIRGHDVRVPYYDIDGHKVWGATAMLLSELEDRLRLVLPRNVLLELT